jgi:IclR family transcriptional regulator, KDG regulon repressor
MIRAVERAFAIFEAFDPQHTMLTLQEIGQRIGLSKATTYRLVNCLHDLGYLVRLEDNRYCLSLKLTRLSGLVRSTIGIREIARPIMRDLVQKTLETITLNTVAQGQRLCIEVFDTPSPLMSIVREGEQTPLLHGATGKILLAYLSSSEIDRIFREAPASKRPNRALLEKQLARYREQGYALTSSERVAGVTAISVPLRDSNGQVRYCISITGPAIRMDRNVDTFVALLLNASKVVSGQMGARADEIGDGNPKSEKKPPRRKKAAG